MPACSISEDSALSTLSLVSEGSPLSALFLGSEGSALSALSLGSEGSALSEIFSFLRLSSPFKRLSVSNWLSSCLLERSSLSEGLPLSAGLTAMMLTVMVFSSVRLPASVA